ncbi:MAG: hypothetical protein ACK5KT_14010 [Dysgonomonas sp.]
MIYNIQKTVDEQIFDFVIDDLILLESQDKDFKKICIEHAVSNEVLFDNAIITLLPTGRVLINYKSE